MTMPDKQPVTFGDLRHRIAIERIERSSDDVGGAIETVVTAAEVWAAIRPRAAGERVAHDRTTGQASHDVWLRYRDDVRADMRIRFGTRVFEILGVVDVGTRRRWLQCAVEERDL